MEKFSVAGLSDGRERGIAYGQATDGFSNMEQSLDNFLDSIMLAQNNVDSNAIMAQPGAPVPQATLVASTSMPNQDRHAKREKDRAYRERQKKRKTEMEGNVKALTLENEALKVEVKALKDEVRASQAENTRLDQAFQSQGQEMDKLKQDFNRWMATHKRQVVLVNGLSDKLVGSGPSPRDEEIQNLKIENDLLRQARGMDNLSLQLIKENAKLKYELEKVKHEKRALEVQVDAVCDKFLAENPSP